MGDNGGGRVRRNAIYLFLGVVVANLASFLFRILLAREFGPDGFGVFSLALMTTSIATVIALLGLPDGVITFVSKFHEQEEYDRAAGVVAASFGLSFGAAVLLAVVVILAAPLLSIRVFDSPALADVLWWFAFVIPANAIVDVSAAYFLGIQRGGYNTLIKQVIPKTALLVLVAVIAVIDGPLVAVGVAYLAAMGVAAVVGIAAVGNSLSRDRIERFSVDIPDLLTYSVPLLATSAIGFFLNWTDTMIVGYMLGSSSVGVYQSAFVLASNIHIVLGAVSGSLYPNFAALLARDKREIIRDRFAEGTRWALLISVAPAMYLIGFPRLSLGMLFGDAFATGATALAILVVGQIAVLLFGPSTDFLKAIEDSRYVAVSYGIAALLNLLLNLLLVPVFGLVGAAVATSTALVGAAVLHFYRVRENVAVPVPFMPLAQALTAGVVAMIVVSVIFRSVNSIPGFGLHIAVFSLVYISGLAATNAVGRNDLQRLRSLLG